ncbi:ArsR/SmtB family transcription factor [Streptomyces sp. NPDC049879]|uniref:ArsR/SmtB family transcription factor n=1 Tax=Streptomyces sp. NPDC049879 TaxID=3365598 RepID=UPI0037B59236
MGDREPDRKRIRDVSLMRALAHPLRSELLGYLMAIGPRTASQCAASVGSTPSNCSWHLRQLARFGLVERAEADDGRERPWRACQVGLELGPFDDDTARRSAQLSVTAEMLRRQDRLTQRFLDSLGDLDRPWQEAMALNDYALLATARELRELIGALDALVRPFIQANRTDAPPEAAPVHLGLRTFLRLEADGRADV